MNYQQVNDDNGVLREDIILRLPERAWIPNDSMNSDWIAYQEWLGEGNTPLPPE